MTGRRQIGVMQPGDSHGFRAVVATAHQAERSVGPNVSRLPEQDAEVARKPHCRPEQGHATDVIRAGYYRCPDAAWLSGGLSRRRAMCDASAPDSAFRFQCITRFRVAAGPEVPIPIHPLRLGPHPRAIERSTTATTKSPASCAGRALVIAAPAATDL